MLLCLLAAAVAAAAVAAQADGSDDCEDGGGGGGGGGGGDASGGDPPVDTLGGVCSANGTACPHPCPTVDGVRRCVPELAEGAACGGAPSAGVCKTDLLCAGGKCVAAAWDEACGENGRRCADGLVCVKPPDAKGGSFASVCFKAVKDGEACTPFLLRNQPGRRAECENGLQCLDGTGANGESTAKCGVSVRESPGPQTNAELGQSCAALPCFDYDWCNPASKVCEDEPAEGKPCATVPTGNGDVCRPFEGLFCDKSGGGAGVCRKSATVDEVCNPAFGKAACSEPSNCVVGADGTARCRQVMSVGYFCDKPKLACWRQGLTTTVPQADGWTQDLRCEAGVCAEDRAGGELTLCEGGEACASGLVCSRGQDGRQRCMTLAPEGAGVYGDACWWTDVSGLFSAYRQYGRRACREGSVCVLPKAETGNLNGGYCYTTAGAGKGEFCNKLYGGTSCAGKDSAGAPVSCEFYTFAGSSETSEVCAGRAANGGACNGNSFNSCVSPVPGSAFCNADGVCQRDDSKVCSPDGTCTAGRQCMEIDGLQACVDYERELGETCERGRQIMGPGIWELKCKPEFTCFSRSLGRFDVSGVCSTVVAPGARCAPAENLECPGACVNGTCQK
jgi:hypothetical protein